MTFTLMIKIVLIAAVVGIIISRWRKKKRAVIEGLEQLRTSDWQGWIEIANTDYMPLFQGKIVATAAARQVANKAASDESPVGLPAKSVERIAGLTKMMYAIVRKVVNPARISVRIVVFFSANLKKVWITISPSR